ncbi:nucleotidyltransferase domain-containing protein [Agromyces atrinae]|uniref:nucleotidyltransferase domain-containing protein n=1 Tax=Agromyces atrinae TaxID=592376 RepID=UPI001F594A01|nr:nucleotidyltransferase domain-containing protein [Agromyces atrinae]MCI2957096.1 nucleotidyltransferase domain-containing protein [Agromyces atrinae]
MTEQSPDSPQDRALAAYLESVTVDPDVLAVIAVGSYARGTARIDSDVDVYLITTDAAFEAAIAADRIAWIDRHDVDYPGGYIDIKLACPAYLAAAVERADDPTRASFEGARVVFERPEVAGIAALIAEIATLPASAWDGRIRSHVAQARLHGSYFLGQAVALGDPFLTQHAASHLALAAARAAFAANRTLLRGPKYVSATLAAVETPAGFVEAWDAVVERSTVDEATAENGRALVALLEEWLGDHAPGESALSTFIFDNELAWLRGTVPAEYF